ncbi:MAG: alpha-ribazole phosphatase family protein [Steroidobacterales bacterium]
MDVYLIRHTRPDLEGSRCYGRLDVELAPGWEQEAIALQARLPTDAAILSSPDRRCRQLAEEFARRTGTDPGIDARLRELDFGAWEGLTWEQIPRIETTHWAKDVWNRAPPDGETYGALYERVSDAWQSLLLMNADRVVVVGNAGPLRALITIALELPGDAFVRIHLDHGSMTLLSDASGGWRLEFANR